MDFRHHPGDNRTINTSVHNRSPHCQARLNLTIAPVAIRAFRESDFGAIAETYAESKLDELCFEADLFELLPLEEDKKRLRETMESRIFVYDDGGILGYGAVYKNEIRALFVRPLSRGQGIGQRLLNHLMVQVEHPPTLYVAKSNAPAKAIYKKYGFIVTREFQTSYNGKAVLANEMMRKPGDDLVGRLSVDHMWGK